MLVLNFSYKCYHYVIHYLLKLGYMSIYQHYNDILWGNSLLPLDYQSSGTAIHNKRQACGFLRPITCWTTTTNLTVEIFVI